jgi:hypothetical protein
MSPLLRQWNVRTWWLAAVHIWLNEVSGACSLIAGDPTGKSQAIRPSPIKDDLRPTLLKEAAKPFAVPPPPNSNIPLQEPAPIKSVTTEGVGNFRSRHKTGGYSGIHYAHDGVTRRSEGRIAKSICGHSVGHRLSKRYRGKVRNWALADVRARAAGNGRF